MPRTLVRENKVRWWEGLSAAEFTNKISWTSAPALAGLSLYRHTLSRHSASAAMPLKKQRTAKVPAEKICKSRKGKQSLCPSPSPIPFLRTVDIKSEKNWSGIHPPSHCTCGDRLLQHRSQPTRYCDAGERLLRPRACTARTYIFSRPLLRKSSLAPPAVR